MCTYYVSMRGYTDDAVILVIDLHEQRVVDKLVLDGTQQIQAPYTKKGVTGIRLHGDFLYAATWDSIYVINTKTKKIDEVITSPLFSDLHGITLANDGSLWVASTNLDSVLQIRNSSVVYRWSAWERPELGETMGWVNQDYRSMQKDDIPYHRFHVNDIFADEETLYVTYLGKKIHQNENIFLRQIKKVLKKPIGTYFDGGLLKIDKKTGSARRIAYINGSHDCLLHKEHFYITEFRGCNIVCVNKKNGKFKRYRLPCLSADDRERLLTRGICITRKNDMVVGYIVRRQYMSSMKGGRIDCFDLHSFKRKASVELAGYFGVYAIVEAYH